MPTGASLSKGVKMLKLRSILLATLMGAGCSTGGLEFWLYPEPHLSPGDGSVLTAYESHRLLAIDGEDVARKCWGEQKGSEAYRRRDLLCRLHLSPGRHQVAVQVGVTNRQSAMVEFTALPGKVYGLDWSNCRTSLEASQRNCRVAVIVVGETEPGR